MPVVLEVTGLDTLQLFLKNVSPRVTNFLATSMEETMVGVFNESQIQVPVDTGALKASGHVDPPEVGPGQASVQIGYGGPAADYALLVHENLAMRHRSPTKAKFLEDPMNAALSSLTTRVAGRMEAAIVGEFATGASMPQMSFTANMRGPSRLARGNRTFARQALSQAQRSRVHATRTYRPFKGVGGRGGLGRFHA